MRNDKLWDQVDILPDSELKRKRKSYSGITVMDVIETLRDFSVDLWGLIRHHLLEFIVINALLIFAAVTLFSTVLWSRTVDGVKYKFQNGQYCAVSVKADRETVTVKNKVGRKDIYCIVDGAFANNEKVKTVIIEEGVVIGPFGRSEKIIGTFRNCINLQSVQIPESGGYTIPDYSFYGCVNLTDISLDNVDYVGNYAFYGCTRLTDINLSSAYHVGDSVFEGCNNVTSLTLKTDSLLPLGEKAFAGCTSISNVTFVANDLSNHKELIEKIQEFTETNRFSVIVPDGTTEIGNMAFKGCTNLVSIEIPNSVTYIGWNAFEGCSSLTDINIPDSVTYIGDNAFYGCTSLTSIQYSGTIEDWLKIDGYDNVGSHITANCTDGVFNPAE